MKKDVLFLCAEDFGTIYPHTFGPIYNDVLRDKYGITFFWVFRTTKEDEISEASWGSSKVVLIPKPDFRKGLVSQYIRYFANLKKAIRTISNRYHFNIIHVFDEPLMGFVGWLASRKNKVPLVYQVTHLKEEETLLYGKYNIYGLRLKNYLRGKVGLLIRNCILRRATVVFAVSDQMRDLFIRYDVKASKIKVIPAGIDCNTKPRDYEVAANKIRASLKLENKHILLYIGTLNRFRKLDFLLDVLKQVLKQYHDAILVVVGGSNEDRMWFKNEAEQKGVADQVILVDTVPRKEIYGYIKAADVCLSPYEPNIVQNCNSPVKLLDYLIMGRPVVGTDIPSQKNIINELDCGFCVEHKIEPYAEAICKILNGYAPNIKKIRKYLENYRSYEVLAAAISDAYNSLIFDEV